MTFSEQPAPPEAILDYWFGAAGSAAQIAGRQSKLWFGKTVERDRDISKRFSATFDAAASGELALWAGNPRDRLALVIVLDQFPHHIHRDTPLAFAQDDMALAQTLGAVDAGEESALSLIERVFLYLPLEHAESMAMQDLAVAKYSELVAAAVDAERALFTGYLDYAHKHREVVARFGRFPHRNAILGRRSSADETEFLKQPGSRF
jgi:uncharacterized protein (DUF924 family)